MFGLYLIVYIFQITGSYFWLSGLHNAILHPVSPQIHTILTCKWSASTDFLQHLNKLFQHLLQVIREVTCDSPNLLQVFFSYFKETSDTQILLSQRPMGKFWPVCDSSSQHPSKQWELETESAKDMTKKSLLFILERYFMILILWFWQRDFYN